MEVVSYQDTHAILFRNQQYTHSARIGEIVFTKVARHFIGEQEQIDVMLDKIFFLLKEYDILDSSTCQ
jgi:hypothetical protein